MADDGAPDADDAWSGWQFLGIQIGLLILGLGGAFFHAFPISVHEPNQNYPDLDLVTIAWLGIVVLAAVLPNITEVGFGQVSIKTQRLQQASSAYETSLDNVANLVQNWSTSMALYIEKMQHDDGTQFESRAKIYADYVRDRMGEAYEMLATRPGERLRLGLWLYDPTRNVIRFATGYQLQPRATEYAAGEGMIGKAFVENRHFNESDVRHVPSYKSTREGEDPPYRAVLCEPVRWGLQPIGMITVDRSTSGFFDYIAEQVAQGLAAQCALAVRVYQSAIAGG